MKKEIVVIIDNDDSFTHILAQYLGEQGYEVVISRSSKTTVAELEAHRPRYLFITSGAQLFREKGVGLEAIKYFAGKIPILGIGLGHQLIAEAYGGKVALAKQMMYGKSAHITHDQMTTFSQVPSPLSVACYHSFVVDQGSLPECFEVSSWEKEGEVMAIRHRELPIEGVQFQLESMLTIDGKQLLESFLKSY